LGVELRSNLIHFGQLIAFRFDPLILHQPQLRQGISSIIMGQLSVQNLGQIWMQINNPYYSALQVSINTTLLKYQQSLYIHDSGRALELKLVLPS
jgi:hypothetical protein